jgi:hypothetical protein
MAGSVTLVLTDGRKLLLNVAQPMPADLVAFEDRFNVSADVLNADDKRVTWSLYIMWRIARRAYPDIMATGFEDFIELVEDVAEGEGDVDGLDPTKAAPPIA